MPLKPKILFYMMMCRNTAHNDHFYDANRLSQCFLQRFGSCRLIHCRSVTNSSDRSISSITPSGHVSERE